MGCTRGFVFFENLCFTIFSSKDLIFILKVHNVTFIDHE